MTLPEAQCLYSNGLKLSSPNLHQVCLHQKSRLDLIITLFPGTLKASRIAASSSKALFCRSLLDNQSESGNSRLLCSLQNINSKSVRSSVPSGVRRPIADLSQSLEAEEPSNSHLPFRSFIVLLGLMFDLDDIPKYLLLAPHPTIYGGRRGA